MDDTSRPQKEYNRTVYVDMDGVIADFEKGIQDITGRNMDSIKDPELWAAIDAHGKAKFFSELPWMPGGKGVVELRHKQFLESKNSQCIR